jgi:hypothetical protein
MKITKAMLKKKGACTNQVALFAEMFPHGAHITEALCVRVASSFNWDWAAAHLLSQPAWTEYKRIRTSASAEYNRTCAPARAEYKRICASAWTEYNRTCAPAFGRLAEQETP